MRRLRSALALSALLFAVLSPFALAVPAQAAARPYIVEQAGPPGHPTVLRQVAAQVLSSWPGGFAASLTASQVSKLRAEGALVEPDRVVSVASTTQTGASWGIDRIDQRALPLNGHYRYATTASDVHAYVIDTGIATADADFGGRAAVAFDALGGDGQDCNGHGTHVAGIVGGTAYGVAKHVQLEAVRVLDCNGQGPTSSILAGITWVQKHAIKPAVANLSLGGSYSVALNRAVNALADSGVFVAVAAGNDGADACDDSPASASDVTTVAATDKNDTRTAWSNTGSCVSLFAPGAAITSDWLDGGTKVLSGTSMATPFVTGAAALYKARYGDAASTDVRSWLVAHGTAGKVKSDPSDTANRLLYTGSI